MKKLAIKILNKNHSEIVQRELFRLGFTWRNGMVVKHTTAKYLVADQLSKGITYASHIKLGDYRISTLDGLTGLSESTDRRFKEGDYYGEDSPEMFKIFQYDGDKSIGFGTAGIFSTNLITIRLQHSTLEHYGYKEMTEKQWVKALINEAERRGLDTCERYKNERGGKIIANRDDKIEAYYENGKLLGLIRGGGNGMLYIRGQWATVIEVPKPIQLPILLGYKPEDNGNDIKYGCMKFDKAWVAAEEFKLINMIEIANEGIINKGSLDTIRAYVAENPGCDDTTEW